MHYRIFYFFEHSGKSVSSANPVEMNVQEIRKQLLPRLKSGDDYVGLIDGSENILQVMSEAGGERFWVEIPLEAAKASYGCHFTRDALEALFDALPGRFDQTSIPGLKYQPW